MFERRHPLQQELARGGRDGADGRRTLRIALVQGWHLTLLAAHGDDGAYRQALAPVLGAEPNRAPRDAQEIAQGVLFNTAPGQHWLVTPEMTLATAVAGALPAHAGSCTVLSHSRVRVALSGAAAARVLAKGISVDLHPRAFGVGQFVQAGLHHSGVLLHRADEERYELYLPRTFARSLWEWLADAALPHGYELSTEGAAAA